MFTVGLFLCHICAFLLVASHPSFLAPHLNTGNEHVPLSSGNALPKFRSFHIHVQFVNDGAWGNNSVVEAMSLRTMFERDFADQLGAPCTGLFEQHRLCMFYVDMEGVGPFVGPQWAVFVPVDKFYSTVPWIMQRRGNFSVLVHPNSADPLKDHTVWALWGGSSWPLNTAVFLNETYMSP